MNDLVTQILVKRKLMYYSPVKFNLSIFGAPKTKFVLETYRFTERNADCNKVALQTLYVRSCCYYKEIILIKDNKTKKAVQKNRTASC